MVKPCLTHTHLKVWRRRSWPTGPLLWQPEQLVILFFVRWLLWLCRLSQHSDHSMEVAREDFKTAFPLSAKRRRTYLTIFKVGQMVLANSLADRCLSMASHLAYYSNHTFPQLRRQAMILNYSAFDRTPRIIWAFVRPILTRRTFNICIPCMWLGYITELSPACSSGQNR